MKKIMSILFLTMITISFSSCNLSKLMGGGDKNCMASNNNDGGGNDGGGNNSCGGRGAGFVPPVVSVKVGTIYYHQCAGLNSICKNGMALNTTGATYTTPISSFSAVPTGSTNVVCFVDKGALSYTVSASFVITQQACQ